MPPNMEMIGFCCNLCACKIDVVIVRIAVKKTESAKIERSGAACSTESLFLNKSIRIGLAKTDIPSALGIDKMAANLRQEPITYCAALTFLAFSSSFSALLIARSAAVSAGVNEDAIGVISADGRCESVTASVL